MASATGELVSSPRNAVLDSRPRLQRVGRTCENSGGPYDETSGTRSIDHLMDWLSNNLA